MPIYVCIHLRIYLHIELTLDRLSFSSFHFFSFSQSIRKYSRYFEKKRKENK